MVAGEREVFGHTPKGETVHRVTISGGGLTAKVLTWGSVIQDLRLEGHEAPLVLGLNTLDEYLRYSPYFGATPGRVANRISAGHFELDGQSYQLELNENGLGHLHGGSDGIAKRNWTIVDLFADRVVLSITDADGRGGYPGNCTITATYHLKDDGVLSVVYDAITDKPTICNVCQHSYFNLDGSDTILDHQIMLAADHYLQVDDMLMPTGSLIPVADTDFDFHQMRPIRREAAGQQVPYDHNFCLSTERTEKRSVALVRSLHSGVAMEVRTTEPGVQFYAGVKLHVPVSGIGGRPYDNYGGFCLETQIWPDAANHPRFPSAVLRPGETLRQETDYVFSRS